MICFVIYGLNIYVSKHKFNSFEKNVWYSNDLLIFVEIFHDFGWFFAIRIRFIEADPNPDPADQNETDPKHWKIGTNLSLERMETSICPCLA